MRLSLLLISAALTMAQMQGATQKPPIEISGLGQPPVLAPFTKLDKLCVNDWWNAPPSPILDTRVARSEVVAFGIYTVQAETLKLSAQLYPLYPEETREVRLELQIDHHWKQVAVARVQDLGWSAQFRIEDWDTTRDHPYRLLHGEESKFQGTIRHVPQDNDEIVLAALSCNSSRDRGLRPHYVRNLLHHDPDLIFFAGDQSYDHREHTAAWIKFGLQFRDTFRDRPAITIPDDHDVGQSNLWGESGKVAKLRGSADGGYNLHPEYVRMVERCQTSHLPDPVDPRPIQQGIGVYFTSLQLGWLDFALLEDRKFKSGPAGKIPQQGPRPDHITTPDYDPESINLEGLVLLGDRQHAFLESWAKPRPGVRMKAVLSQTGLCGGAHLHGDKKDRILADLARIIHEDLHQNAVHIAGDQHLATVIQHGIDEFRDGPWAFVVPASVNTIYERWWSPLGEAPGASHDPKAEQYPGWPITISIPSR